MGDGADMPEEGQPQNGGEYYSGGMTTPAAGPWGPPDASYGRNYMQPQPAYPQQPMPAYPQHMQPPMEYQPQPPPVQRQPRRRKASKGMQRMYLVQYFEAVLDAPLFGDPNDTYANMVQEEVSNFVLRRIDELLGEAPEKANAEGFTIQEMQALKVLAQRMLEPEVQETPKPVAAAPEPVKPPDPVIPPRPTPPVLKPPTLPPPPPQMGPRVISRPTPAQRQALDRARQAPQSVAPVRQPPAQMVNYPPTQAVAPPVALQPRKKGKRAQVTPTGPAPVGPPPPMRFSTPLGMGATSISAMKAEQQIAEGEVVMSTTFVKGGQ